MPTESVVRFRTLDGLHLAGEEGGFFTRLAAGLGGPGWCRCALTCAGTATAKPPAPGAA